MPVYDYCERVDLDEPLENQSKSFETTFDASKNVVEKDCVDAFLNYLLTDEHNGFQVIAHIGGKYDNHLLINKLQQRKDKQVELEVLANGSRYLTITVRWKGEKLSKKGKMIKTTLSLQLCDY